MVIARQSTARTFMVGPVLDADGVAVTDGVVADFEVSKNGGDPAALNGSATLTHRGVGFYSLAATASDLDTVGQAEFLINDTVNACPIKVVTVVEEAVYDELFAASALGYVANAPVSVAQWAGTNVATPTVAGVPEVDLTHVAGATTNVAALATNVDAILTDTAEIGAAGAGLTNINLPNQTMDIVGNITGSLSGSVGSVTGLTASNLDATISSRATPAQVNSEVDTALADIHLDHLLATEYDPQSKPGAAGALLNEIVESDDASPGRARFTAGALEEAPTGGSAPTVGQIADAVWDEDLTGHTTPDTAGEILGNVATGTPPTAEAIADEVETRTIAAVTTVNGLANNVITTAAINDGAFTAAKFAADFLTAAKVAADVSAEIASAVWGAATRLLTAGTNIVLAKGVGITGFNDLSSAQVNTEADTALADVGLTTTVTGRVDAAITTRAAASNLATLQTSVDDLPTNAELTAALGALNNLSSAQAQTAAAAALTAYDPPTNAEMEARTLTAALIAKLTAHLGGLATGVIGSGSSTTAVVFNAATGVNGAAPSSVNDHYNGRVIIFLTGALALQATSITDYVGSTVTATVPALTSAPQAGDTFILV